MLKEGHKDYIEERLQVFRPYSAFMQHIGIYDTALGEDHPASSHVRSWRGKLNILHLNTALVAGNLEKDGQVADVDTAAAPTTWEHYYDEKVPSIAVGHNSFYDLKEDQRHDLAGAFALRKVSAYLAGDMSQAEKTPEHQMIRMESGSRQGEEIPNLVAGKSTVDENGALMEAGFCWHYWDEASDKVSVEFRRWSKDTLGKTNRTGEDGGYTMRHEKTGAPEVKDKPVTGPGAITPSGPADPDAELREHLARVLVNRRDEHPSFRLMTVDEIDRRLYPGIENYERIEPMAKSPAENKGTNRGVAPVWEIIKNSWASPKHRNVVITGEGGIGKTVALFSITFEADGTVPVPALYIPMYELAGKDGEVLELDEYIRKRYRRYSGRIEKLALGTWDGKPRLLVLLDGFNELPFSLRKPVLKMVNDWIDFYTGVQVIAVSRTMDGLNLITGLHGDPVEIRLTPLEDGTVREYLEKAKQKVPAENAPVWEDLHYPLFLTLYAKTGRLEEMEALGYPLRVMDADSGGALIWNYLQRELLRHAEDEPSKAQDWFLRCAVANEYILPYLAFRMVSEQRMEVSYRQAGEWVQEALDQFDGERLPHHLRDVCDAYEREQHRPPERDMFSLDAWRDTVLWDTGILIPPHKSKDKRAPVYGRYVFMHQHFRDCLAGLYLVNQAEMAGEDSLPEVWKHGQNHLALDYAAELMDKDTADKLWEINRVAQQYSAPGYVRDPSSTFALLELQKRRKPIPKDLDFSGMDLRDLNLALYLGRGKGCLPLFQTSILSYDTKINRSTFQNEGHSRGITCISVFPDGRIVSGSSDWSLRVWNPSTGQNLQVLEGHSGCVNCVAVLGDGRIVSGSADATLRIWDASSGQCLISLKGHSKGIRCVSVLPDGRIVSGSSDRTLRVWDPDTGQCLLTLKGHTKAIRCVSVLSDGKVVSGSSDKSLRIWDLSTGQNLLTLKGHSGYVNCVAVLGDGKIVSGSMEGTLRVWDSIMGRCLLTLEGHFRYISSVSVLPDGRIVSGSHDRTLRIWDSVTGQCLQTLRGHLDIVRCVSVLLDGRVVSGSNDCTLRVWDSATGECLQILRGHLQYVSCLTVLLDGRVVSGSHDRTLRVWNPSSCQCLFSLKKPYKGVKSLSILPDDKVISGSADHTLRIWDSSTGRCLSVLEGYSGLTNCMSVFPDGRVVSSLKGNSLQVWDSSTGQCLLSLKEQLGNIKCVSVLSDDRVVSGSTKHHLRIWDSSTGQNLQVLEGHSGCVNCVAVLGDGRIVSGSADTTLRIWDASSGQCLISLKGHSKGVRCVSVLPDGRVVSGSSDHTLRVWDSFSGCCLLALEGHSARVNSVAAFPDGRVVSCSDDRTLRVWDTLTGECLQILQGNLKNVICVSVLSNGRVICGSADSTLRIWDLDTGKCLDVLETMEIDVSQMDFSSAILTKDLVKPLWQNGAKISEKDYNRVVNSLNIKQQKGGDPITKI